MANRSDQPLEIPGFDLLSIAGRGGMGVVYLAQQHSPNRRVALKILNRTNVGPAQLEALRREAELAAGLEHPAIVPLYDYGEIDGTPYLVFRYLSGGTAASRLKTGRVDFDSAIAWVTRVAQALAFAHQRGLVHRDVKPSNFLLDEDDNAYLTDFGIAGALEFAGDQTASGSAPYMAPEQIRGDAVGPASDLYSLAISLFELITGEIPYKAETALGVRARHLHDPIPSVREKAANIPLAMDELIAWTMAKNPDHRPKTAAQFVELLDQAQRFPDRSLKPARQPEREKGGGRSVGLWLALAAVVVVGGLAALLGLGALGYFALRPTPTPNVAVTRPATEEATVAITASPRGQLLREDFTRSGEVVVSPPDPDGGVVIRDGALQFEVLILGAEWFYPSKAVNVADVVQSVAVEDVQGGGMNEIGLMCRWQDAANHVALAVSSDGTAAIWKRESNEITRLAEAASPQPLARSGELAAECEGPRLALYWDGGLLVQAEDPAPQAGDIGLLVGSLQEGQLLVTLDDWEARAP